ncbi:DUF4397 domain-containing protein [Flavihumibacter petaseus]|nr:DUF4397 domain-containing protein [Flavihumibacter petaseus]
MKSTLKLFAVFSLVAILATSCLKSSDNQPATPVAGLMAFNLAPDQNSMGIRLNGNNLTNQPLSYTNYTGAYLPIYVGDRSAWAFDYSNGAPLTEETKFSAAADQYYSLFVVGSDSSYKTLVTTDNLDSLPFTAGKAFVRYINAIVDTTTSPEVIVAGGSTSYQQEVSFGQVSAFQPIDAGDIAVSVKAGTTIDKSRTFPVEANKIYTVLLVGEPGAAGNKAVDIKYVVNGTIQDSTAHQ